MPTLCLSDCFRWRLEYLSHAFAKAISTQTLMISLIGVSVLVAQAAPGQADETSEVTSGIIIEEAFLDSEKRGERTRLRFGITILSTRNVTLRGIRAKAAKSAEMKMKLDDVGLKPVQGGPILREEELTLLSSHIRIELVDFLEDLKPDFKSEFDLVFGDFETSAIADVH